MKRGRLELRLQAAAQSAHKEIRPSPADKAANEMLIPYSEDGPLMLHSSACIAAVGKDCSETGSRNRDWVFRPMIPHFVDISSHV